MRVTLPFVKDDGILGLSFGVGSVGVDHNHFRKVTV